VQNFSYEIRSDTIYILWARLPMRMLRLLLVVYYHGRPHFVSCELEDQRVNKGASLSGFRLFCGWNLWGYGDGALYRSLARSDKSFLFMSNTLKRIYMNTGCSEYEQWFPLLYSILNLIRKWLSKTSVVKAAKTGTGGQQQEWNS
jgi:hypothetical protein